MKVGFYGHVRQYHNIKAEIDANIAQVLESGEYVHGPMNKQFEKELAAFSRHEIRHPVRQRHGRPLADA
jgi:dTDP-4-amino-4,6-dideoxygalactose transaminase